MPTTFSQSNSEQDRRRATIRGEGVDLAVFARGEPDRPTLVFVHGYPDTHAVWDRVIDRLADDFHCVSFDVRGAGASARPRPTRAYRLSRLAADLIAVIDWASPDAPVHLVGHDWGSIQSWEVVTDPAFAGRLAGFTSISGPCLDHAGHWLRAQRRSDPSGLRRQLRKSWYIAALHVPLLPQLAWHGPLGARWPHTLAALEGERLPTSATLARDGAHGAKLYRANMLPRLMRPRDRRARCPVQIVVPQRDAFVGPGFVDDLGRWVADLEVVRIDAAHWAIQTHPDTVADHCRAFARGHIAAPSEPAPQTGPKRQSPAHRTQEASHG